MARSKKMRLPKPVMTHLGVDYYSTGQIIEYSKSCRDFELTRLRGYLKKIASQTDQRIILDLVDCALRGESLDYCR